MSIILHKPGFERAKTMIMEQVEVEHISDNWEEVKPTVDDELTYIDNHSLDEYGLWFLGIDTDAPVGDRSKFVYPYGDFDVVQESALIAAQEQANKNHHDEIAEAARKLLVKIAHTKTM